MLPLPEQTLDSGLVFSPSRGPAHDTGRSRLHLPLVFLNYFQHSLQTNHKPKGYMDGPKFLGVQDGVPHVIPPTKAGHHLHYSFSSHSMKKLIGMHGKGSLEKRKVVDVSVFSALAHNSTLQSSALFQRGKM